MPGRLLTTRSDLGGAVSEIGAGPYALKVISPDIVHKTDAGAVRLNIVNLEQAESAWDDLQTLLKEKLPRARIEGISFQKMGFGREVIVGLKRDPVFGPAVLFGLGGIFTELLKDTAIRIAPFDDKVALEMIREIRGFGVLNGLRGDKAVDFEALAKVIVAVAKIGLAHQEIKEIDLNPVMVSEQGAVVVDGRMMG